MTRARRIGANAMLAEIDTAVRALSVNNVGAVRAVRRRMTSRLEPEDSGLVYELARLLLRRDRAMDRFIAYELIASHAGAMRALSATRLRELGAGMDSWDDVDCFGCYLAGVAWREGSIGDGEIRRWSRSPDRWWRRAALVSTVPLNVIARGGTGDAKRTLAVCDWLKADRDPMVVKALSWSLRSLVPRDADAVRRYVERNAAQLPALALRETRTKLATGLKNPRRSKRGAPAGSPP